MNKGYLERMKNFERKERKESSPRTQRDFALLASSSLRPLRLMLFLFSDAQVKFALA
jgi:hypothetical protein